jgi:photosystem II oxygen-evolving enhancer protein 1
MAGAALMALGLSGASTAFLQGSAPRVEPPSAPAPGHFLGAYADMPDAAVFEAGQQAQDGAWFSAASVLGLGAMLGLALGVLAPQPASAITAEQFSQLTYYQVKGSGLANRCPTVESKGESIPIKSGARLINACFEPKSFAVETDTENGKQFVTTKLLTRQTYTLTAIEGDLTSNPITFKEKTGMDFQATTVKLPNGQYVPFLFTLKNLQAKGEGSAFKPGFTWGGEFDVNSYRTGGFLDPKNRGMVLGYDQAVARPAMMADGKNGQDKLFRETNKVFDIGRGAIEMEVNKVNADLGEIGGVFVSKQPSDTDMGAKEPKTILLKGIFYGKVV